MAAEKRVVFRSRWLPWTLLAPQGLVIAVFFFWPAGQAVVQSFQQSDAFGTSVEWVGLDNFRNLFELPVLFYAGVLLAAHIGVSDMVSLALAWAFVGLRAVRSAVHCTFNHVMTRFVAYALATLVLIAFWARLAFALAAA